MSTTTDSHLDIHPNSQPDVESPSQCQVIDALKQEAAAAGVACDTATAWSLLDMLERAVELVRSTEHTQPYHLREHELGQVHSVLDIVMPDDVVAPAAGSAHALLNRHLLSGEELTLVHTRDKSRGIEWCAVEVQIRTA